MSEDVNDRQLHQGAETNRAARVVTEDEKSRPIGPYLHEAHTVQDGRHRVLADAKMEIATAMGVGLKITGAIEGQPSLSGWGQIRRSTHQPWNSLGDCIQYLAGRVPRCQTRGVRSKGRQLVVPAIGQLALLHALDLIRQCWKLSLVFAEVGLPGSSQLAPPGAEALCKVFAHTVRHKKFRVFGPSVAALGQLDLFLTQRFAMGRGTILLMR